MSSTGTNMNMKTKGDNGISIQNYGQINLTIISEGEKERRSKRKRKSGARDTTPDHETISGKKCK